MCKANGHDKISNTSRQTYDDMETFELNVVNKNRNLIRTLRIKKIKLCKKCWQVCPLSIVSRWEDANLILTM